MRLTIRVLMLLLAFISSSTLSPYAYCETNAPVAETNSKMFDELYQAAGAAIQAHATPDEQGVYVDRFLELMAKLSPQQQLALVKDLSSHLQGISNRLRLSEDQAAKPLVILAFASAAVVLLTANEMASRKPGRMDKVIFLMGLGLGLCTVYMKSSSNERIRLVQENTEMLRKSLFDFQQALETNMKMDGLDNDAPASKTPAVGPTSATGPTPHSDRSRDAREERSAYANRHRESRSTID